MKAAILRITPELLADFLHLPKGATITGAEFTNSEGARSIEGADYVELRLEHDDFPDTAVGGQFPSVCPEYRRQDPVAFVGWGLSK